MKGNYNYVALITILSTHQRVINITVSRAHFAINIIGKTQANLDKYKTIENIGF